MKETNQKELSDSIDLQKLLRCVKDEFQRCIQCGKCVGICPAAEVTPFNSRKIIHRIKMGDIEGVLDSDEIWSCVLCSCCYAVCPNEINFTNALMVLRVLSFYYGYGWQLDMLALPFVDQYLNTGMAISDAESPEIMEVLKANSGTDGTIAELRKLMGLEPKRHISAKAIDEIEKLAKSCKLLEKVRIIKDCGQSRKLINEPEVIALCNEIFMMIGNLPGGK